MCVCFLFVTFVTFVTPVLAHSHILLLYSIRLSCCTCSFLFFTLFHLQSEGLQDSHRSVRVACRVILVRLLYACDALNNGKEKDSQNNNLNKSKIGEIKQRLNSVFLMAYASLRPVPPTPSRAGTSGKSPFPSAPVQQVHHQAPTHQPANLHRQTVDACFLISHLAAVNDDPEKRAGVIDILISLFDRHDRAVCSMAVSMVQLLMNANYPEFQVWLLPSSSTALSCSRAGSPPASNAGQFASIALEESRSRLSTAGGDGFFFSQQQQHQQPCRLMQAVSARACDNRHPNQEVMQQVLQWLSKLLSQQRV